MNILCNILCNNISSNNLSLKVSNFLIKIVASLLGNDKGHNSVQNTVIAMEITNFLSIFKHETLLTDINNTLIQCWNHFYGNHNFIFNMKIKLTMLSNISIKLKAIRIISAIISVQKYIGCHEAVNYKLRF